MPDDTRVFDTYSAAFGTIDSPRRIDPHWIRHRHIAKVVLLEFKPP